ncbi:peptidoglycan DD-metalloendopeptidase family protein [Parashewanella spongiae]|uniref:peptidoglycan DD-metalloendopeptidase family protein n=1 Tax=Parashewanella spongiae TaxID=342950 RepID=UPI001FB2AB96|nr:peptidoglycan DD-metalloendopeptidase family protein [Parashewanella spongiae]MCL1077793.1 peptidoglycan DD-metalloendopeptidase family protein [Parashewanella spongiae]
MSSFSPAPVSTASANKYKTKKKTIHSRRYKVKRGDTLYSIAWAADKDYKAIAWLNKLKKPYVIYPGQWLTIVKLNPKQANRNKTSAKVKKTSPLQKNNDKKISLQNRSKKILDKKKPPAYSVTESQQKNNNKSIQKDGISLKKVSRWNWPYKGKIISRFSNKTQGNKGLKFAGRRGDAIKAAAAGKVVYAGNALRGYGNLVIIKHNNNYLSAYAHAEKILVKEQQQVALGQAVATMGSTGTNRVILHFEIRYHGKSVNPLQYLPK